MNFDKKYNLQKTVNNSVHCKKSPTVKNNEINIIVVLDTVEESDGNTDYLSL